MINAVNGIGYEPILYIYTNSVTVIRKRLYSLSEEEGDKGWAVSV